VANEHFEETYVCMYVRYNSKMTRTLHSSALVWNAQDIAKFLPEQIPGKEISYFFSLPHYAYRLACTLVSKLGEVTSSKAQYTLPILSFVPIIKLLESANP